jgi:hypothetical protein
MHVALGEHLKNQANSSPARQGTAAADALNAVDLGGMEPVPAEGIETNLSH